MFADIKKTISSNNYLLRNAMYAVVTLEQPVKKELFLSNKELELPESIELKKKVTALDPYTRLISDDANKSYDCTSKILNSASPVGFSISLSKALKDYTTADLVKCIESYFDSASLSGVTSKVKKFIEPTKSKDYFSKTFSDLYAYLMSEERATLLEKVKQYWLDNITRIYDLGFTDRVIILLDIPLAIWQQERKLYLYPRIFGKNKDSILIGDVLYGTYLYGMNGSDDKPFLNNLTRPIKRSSYLNLQDSLALNELYTMLQGLEVKNKSPQFEQIGSHSIKVSFTQTGTISDYYLVPKNALEVIRFKFIDYVGSNRTYPTVTSEKELSHLVMKYLFVNKIKDFTETRVVTNNSKLRSVFQSTKHQLHSLFTMGETGNLVYTLRRNLLNILNYVASLSDEKYVKNNIIDTFNFTMSFIQFLGGEVMNKEFRNVDIIRKEIDDDTLKMDDNMYYYLVGQIGSHLVNRSTTEYSFNRYLPLLNARNNEQLLVTLNRLLKRYGSKVKAKRFNQIRNLIAIYKPTTKLNYEMQEMLIAGITAEDIVFDKKITNDSTKE